MVLTIQHCHMSTPQFDWPLANDAEALLRRYVATFLAQNSFARQLADRMRDETGTDFFEWVDHLIVSPSEKNALLDAGFVLDNEAESPDGESVYENPRATLPRVMLRPGEKQNPSIIALRPEFVADLIPAHNLSADIEGEPFSRYRRAIISEENGTRVEAVERHAYRGFVPVPLDFNQLRAIIKAKELWQTRRRLFPNDTDGFDIANKILDQSLELVGRDLSCEFFFASERAYWESRNRAAQIQKRRQDQLGLGWGNHDHHTFRCSREHFVDLIQFLL